MNEQKAKYLVVEGMAIIQHGFTRATEDIDFLVEESRENQARVYRAMDSLPDHAIRELGDDDLRDYVVVRVADEFVVDLMIATCGIAYAEAARSIVTIDLDGVSIPFATPELLLRTKQTFRDKDAVDRVFLQNKIARREEA